MNIHVGGIQGVKKTYVEKASDFVCPSRGRGWHEAAVEVSTTDGSNLRECLAVEEVDWKHTSCNDVHEVVSVLGVEAGVVVLGREMDKVVRFDGGYIDRKHITLLTESIMRRGFMCPNTRHGMALQRVGVLMRASSFETTTDVFNESACHAMSDKVSGITENIMFANSIPSGTGMVEAIACKQRKRPTRHPKQNDILSKKQPERVVSRWNFFADVHDEIERVYLDDDDDDEFIGFPVHAPDESSSPKAKAQEPPAPHSPAYAPESPVYAPQSPAYEPESPAYEPESPAYEPESPAYAPQSPAYEPESPAYEPESPAYAPESPSIFPEDVETSVLGPANTDDSRSPKSTDLDARMSVFTSEDYTRGFSVEDLPSSRGVSSPRSSSVHHITKLDNRQLSESSELDRFRRR